MGLLDFDVSKITNNPAFQLGTGILANNTGHYGQFGPALQGGMNDYTRQQAYAQQAAQQKAQQEWMQKNGYGGMPPEFALAKFKGSMPGSTEYGTTVQMDKDGNSYLVGKDGTIKKLGEKFVKPSAMLNLGGYQLPVNPVTGMPSGPSYQYTPKPTETPEYQADVETAKQGAKSKAENTSLYAEMQSMQPKLESTVSRLKDLAQDATYTTAGRAYDWTLREMGAPVPKGAVARAEFQSTIDNNVLPLLRQTFGAAFTAEEGDRLRATMGDANLSPEEKMAQLDSFIENKRQEVERYSGLAGEERQTNALPLPQNPSALNLKKGKTYITPMGELIWNGKAFEEQ